MIFTILILISAVAVVKVMWEITESRKCPTNRDLKKVVLGRAGIDTPLANRVQRHLGICSKCRDKIDGFIRENPSDHLIAEE